MTTSGSTFRTAEPDLSKLLEQVHAGELQLPDFQRGWVWDDNHIRSLIASVSRSFPIGSVMLLETGGEGVRFKPRVVEGAPENGTSPQQLILDGQQRMTSLYLALRSGKPVPTRTEKGKKIDRVYYLNTADCLDPEVDREDAVLSLPADRIVRTNFNRDIALDLSSEEKEYELGYFPLFALFDTARYSQWRRGYQRAHRQDDTKLDLFDNFEEKVLDAIKRYRVPAIELTRHTSKEAVCQVFEKVNTGGVALTVFELMTATFAADDFDLRKDWEARKQRLQEKDVLTSVEATDFLQAVMISFMFVALGICAYRVIQWDSVSTALLEHKDVDLLLNPFSKQGQFGLKYFIYVIISKVFFVACWAPSNQKISSASSPREARIMMLLYNLRICSTAGLTYIGIASIAVMTLPQFGFLGLVKEVAALPPEIQTQMIGTILLTKLLPVGIMGLMFAGMMAAFISTNDSYMLTWAGVIVQDVICPLRKKPLGQKQHLRLLRIVVVLVGIFIYFFGLYYKPGEAIIIFQQLTGMIYGAGAGAMITYGLYWRRGNTAGAYAALIVGAIIPIANKILEVKIGEGYPFPGISGGLLALGAAHVAYFLGTFLTKNPHFDLEKMLNRKPNPEKNES